MHTVTCRACARPFPVEHPSSRPETFTCRDCKTLSALSLDAGYGGDLGAASEALAREIVADVLQGGNVDRMQWAQYFDGGAADEPTDPIARIIVGDDDDDDDDEPTATVRVFAGLITGSADGLRYLQGWREKAGNPHTYRIRDAFVQSFIERDRETVWHAVLGTEVILWIPDRLSGKR